MEGNVAEKVHRSCRYFREFYFGSSLLVSHELKAYEQLEWLDFLLKESNSHAPRL